LQLPFLFFIAWWKITKLSVCVCVKCRPSTHVYCVSFIVPLSNQSGLWTDFNYTSLCLFPSLPSVFFFFFLLHLLKLLITLLK